MAKKKKDANYTSFCRTKDKSSTNRMQQKVTTKYKAKEECLVQDNERQKNRITITQSTGKWGTLFFVL